MVCALALESSTEAPAASPPSKPFRKSETRIPHRLHPFPPYLAPRLRAGGLSRGSAEHDRWAMQAHALAHPLVPHVPPVVEQRDLFGWLRCAG